MHTVWCHLYKVPKQVKQISGVRCQDSDYFGQLITERDYKGAYDWLIMFCFFV